MESETGRNRWLLLWVLWAIAPVNLWAATPPKPLAGTQFLQTTRHLERAVREEAILREVSKGHVPNFLRQFTPVPISGYINNKRVEGTFWCAPDYVSVGHDFDYVRVPMGFPTAKAIARQLNFMLPTAKMVDAIYDAASIKLFPQPMTPGPEAGSNDYYLRHQQLVNAQLRFKQPKSLMAGHKKDIVLTGRLWLKEGRVAIYGWHKLDGLPIQPLSLVHGENYVDYSHGVRLIYPLVMINRQWHYLEDVLASPHYAAIFSDEGPISPLINLPRPLPPLNPQFPISAQWIDVKRRG